jgi:hypothetical protein
MCHGFLNEMHKIISFLTHTTNENTLCELCNSYQDQRLGCYSSQTFRPELCIDDI